MKKILTIMFIALTGICLEANAQCTPPSATGTPGISPDWETLQCAQRGVAYSTIINVENLSSVVTSIGTVTVNSLVVDTILKLPSGLSYTITPSNNIPPGATACVDVVGVTNDTVGCYLLDIIIAVNVTIPGFGQIPLGPKEARALVKDIEALTGSPTGLDFSYYIQVTEQGGTCDCTECVDTATCVTGITYLEGDLENIEIKPNPFSQRTDITFDAINSGIYHAKMHDVGGKEVYSAELEVTVGKNSFRLERGNLAEGVYFYTLSNEKNSITQRIVIRE